MSDQVHVRSALAGDIAMLNKTDPDAVTASISLKTGVWGATERKTYVIPSLTDQNLSFFPLAGIYTSLRGWTGSGQRALV